MIGKRLMETFAMAIIGDSLLCVVSPRRHLSLWLNGPQWWRHTWEPFVRFPGLTRVLGMLGLGFGLWLAWTQEPQLSKPPVQNGALPHRWSRMLAVGIKRGPTASALVSPAHGPSQR